MGLEPNHEGGEPHQVVAEDGGRHRRGANPPQAEMRRIFGTDAASRARRDVRDGRVFTVHEGDG